MFLSDTELLKLSGKFHGVHFKSLSMLFPVSLVSVQVVGTEVGSLALKARCLLLQAQGIPDSL